MKLNHEAKSLGDAFNLSDNIQNRITATIMYEFINRQYQIEHLYDDVDDAPLELTTTSGMLEACINKASGAAEKLYTVWEFAKIEMLKRDKNKIREFVGIMSLAAMTYSLVDKDYEKFCTKFSKGLDGAKTDFFNSHNDEDE